MESKSAQIKFEQKLSILEKIFGDYERKGRQYDFKCQEPDCNPDEKKLTVNIEKNLARCWHCGYGYRDIRYLVRKYGYQYYQEWLDVCGISIGEVGDLKHLIQAGIDGDVGAGTEEEEPVTLPDGFTLIAPRWDTIMMRAPVKYLTGRGLTKRDVIRWQVGFVFDGALRDRVIFPSYDAEGKLNYWVGRKIVACDHRDRFMNPRNDKNGLVFNEFSVDWEAPVVLVEGIIDAMKVARGNAIPTLGSSITEKSRLFQKIIENKTPVIFGFDHDAARKTMKLARLFESYGIRTREARIDKDRDFGAMNTREVERRILRSEERSEDDLLRKLLEEQL
jgi:DNA primase